MVKVTAAPENVPVDPFEELLGPAGSGAESPAADAAEVADGDSWSVEVKSYERSDEQVEAGEQVEPQPAEAHEAPEAVVVSDDDGEVEPPAPLAVGSDKGGWMVETTIEPAMSAFDRRLKDAESAFLEASLELSELKTQLDELKSSIKEKQKEVDGLALNLRSLREKGDDHPDQLELFDEHGNGRATDAAPVAFPPAGQAAPASQPLAQPNGGPNAGPDAWRSVPIEQLGLATVKGLGKKKLDAIYELAPTIGKLEDLRAEWGGLTNIPGIGPEKQTAIEDRLIDWLSANRDSEVLRAARGERPKAEKAEDAEETDEADEPADDGEFEGGLPHDHDSRERHVAQVREAAESLRNDGLDDLQPTLAGETHWQAGYEARQIDAAVDVCPFSPSDAQTDWLRGWLTADHELSESEDGDAEEAS